MRVLYLLIVGLLLGSVCIGNVHAQTSGDLQQQINALQQQLNALKQGAGQGSQGAWQGAPQGSQGWSQQGQQGRAVQLRPTETGRSATLRGRQGTQRSATTSTRERQLERRLEQLRAEQANRQRAAQGGGQQGAQGMQGYQGAVQQGGQGGQMMQGAQGAVQQGGQMMQGAQGMQGAVQQGGLMQGAQGAQGGYYTPQAQYNNGAGAYDNWSMPNSGRRQKRALRTPGGYNAGGYGGYGDAGGYGAGGYGGYGDAGGYGGYGAGGYGGRGAPGYNSFAIKTNLASLAVMAPNLGLEFGLGRKMSLDLSFQYNGWGRAPETSRLALQDGTGKLYDSTTGIVYKNKQTDHLLGKAELRLWLMERMQGHFLGLHALYSKYDVYGVKVPLLFEKDLRYDGTALGFGIGYGYKWAWNHRWGLEATFGLGMVSMDYDKTAWNPNNVANVDAGRFKKTYFGPTNIGARVYFMLR